MTVSIVFLQATLSEFTRRAVSSMRASELVPDEIIVVDNGSPEEDKAWAKDGDIHLIELEKNFGYHVGMNTGWKAAAGDYIILCNNDIAFSKQCIRRLVLAMDRNPDYGWMMAGYITGHFDYQRVPAPNDVLDETTNSQGEILDKFNVWAEGLGDEPVISHAPFLEDVVTIVRKSVSDQIGYFWEDIKNGRHTHDYAMRLALAGYKQGIVRNAAIWHRPFHCTISKYKLYLSHEEVLKTNDLMNERWGKGWEHLSPKDGVRWEDMR